MKRAADAPHTTKFARGDKEAKSVVKQHNKVVRDTLAETITGNMKDVSL